jgi:dipeptidyl aminopeptidase/acylaminoacyl peptidase
VSFSETQKLIAALLALAGEPMGKSRIVLHLAEMGIVIPATTLDDDVKLFKALGIVSESIGRGFAVLDVNYGGSSGFGRASREALKGQWGVVDVDDCVAGARHLAARGMVDPERLVIRGGSAGGLTTLCALTFHDVFKAGASYYGVSDLKGLDDDSHKFESHYNEYLIAPQPEAQVLYLLRSPINHADQLKRPMIFFQGLDDKVVPPQQSEVMVNALREAGVPVAYITLEGEGHGFRKADSIVRTLEAELYFYLRVFGITSPEALAPVAIDNLPEAA